MRGSSKRFRASLDALEQRSRGDLGDRFAPVLFDANKNQDELAATIERGEVRVYRDCYLAQLRELGITRHASDEDFASKEAASWVEGQLAGTDPAAKGVYVYYPWSGALVHVLDREEFLELRTNRNQYKITRDEQARLWSTTIGVVGLSVGHAAATTLALEGIGGRLRLADYDALELSNLNRIRTRLEMLSLNKAVVAAREVYEINPYLEVEIFPNGIDEESIEGFLAGPPQLDLLVEECDDLFAKIRLRERARELRIPVVMDTSDRGMLDIERFDREPTRPIFHGLLGTLKAEDVRGLTMKEKIPHVFRIVGEDSVSPRLAASMLEVKQSIYTWPQLGSDVTLGGALVAHGARRILLGEATESGRRYVDLDRALETVTPLRNSPVVAGGDSADEELPTVDFDTTAPIHAERREQIRWMVAAAHLAPSAGNQQPWRFALSANGDLSLRADPALERSFLDYRGLATELALGAAVENLAIAASHLGMKVEVEPASDDGSRQLCFLAAGASQLRDPLLDAIPMRVTNRRRDKQPQLSDDAIERIIAAANSAAGRLIVRGAEKDKDRVGELAAAADRVRYLHPVAHDELMRELRWTRREALQRRDGITLSELGLSAFDEAGLRLARKSETIRLVRQFGGGEGVGTMSKQWFRASSAVALYIARARTATGAFQAGRAIQRLWLTATAERISLQPITGLLYLGMRAADGCNELSADEQVLLTQLLTQVRELFEVDPSETPLFLCRLVMASDTTPIHLRYDLDEILSMK